MEVIFWIAFTVLLAYMQGALMPAIRRTPPGAEAAKQAIALHVVGGAAYLLPLLPLVWLEPARWLVLVAACLLSRLALFDPVLNGAAGRPLFEVGQTATTDKLLRRLAGARASLVSAVLRGAALSALLVLLSRLA